MDDLAAWYRAQLDEDERIVQATAWCWSAQIDNPWTARAPRDEEEGWTVWSKGSALMARGLEEADAQHIAEHDPARVLREIDAKRQLLALHREVEDPEEMQDYCATCEVAGNYPYYPCMTLRLLALPYADRPGYRDDWRP